MASSALGTNFTLSEIARREDPNGDLYQLIDTASIVTPLLLDATWTECNRITIHECARVSTKPSGTERVYNEGVPQEAGVTTPHTEDTCMLAGLSLIDSKLLQHSPDQLAARMQEDELFFIGMNETFESRFLTGNRASDPRQINGLENRPEYNSLTSPDSNQYVWDNSGGNGSGTSNKTDIWMVQWGMRRINLIYPRNDPVAGTEYGITLRDFGEDLETDLAGNRLPMWRTWFEFNFGIFIWDPRCVKRIANISTTNINNSTDFGFDENYLIRAYNSFKYGKQGIVIYVNEEMENQMWIRAKDKSNVMFDPDKDVFGNRLVRFQGSPIRKMDTIGNTGALLA